jgi:hypothetical protein
VVGALLFGSSIVTTLLVARRPVVESVTDDVGSTSREPVMAGAES